MSETNESEICAHCNSCEVKLINSNITEGLIYYDYKCNVCHKHTRNFYRLAFVRAEKLG